MRACEFIKEDAALLTDVADALPTTYVMPELKNQDPYLQYRFGLAIAAARAQKAGEVEYHDESEYGENMIVLARSPEEEETLDLALALYGKDNAKRLITTSKSEESSDTYTQSPMQPNRKKLGRST